MFHNDVVAVSNQNVLLFHGDAYENTAGFVEEVRRKYTTSTGQEPILLMADSSELSLSEAVESYLFNSQLITLPDGTMSLIAPIECREHPRAAAFIQRVLDSETPIKSVHFLDVHQSMNNGGGPACLRLRVVLTQEQLRQVHGGVIFTHALHTKLIAWVNRNYRESIQMDDLADPSLAQESAIALDQLKGMLGL